MSVLCTLCGKEYSSEKQLQIHIANTDCNNEDQQVKKCSTCEIEILGNRKYFNQLANHETISCKLCNNTWNKNSEEEPKKGTPQHLIQSKRTLTGYNSRRAGYSPAHEMTIRKVKPSQSPLV